MNALPDDHARLMFEMEHKHDKTVGEMLKWPYDNPNVADVKFENLIEDENCARFRAMLTDFDIAGLGIDRACKTYWDLSLFGGLATKVDMTDRTALHVTSGEKAQWVTKLPREIAEPYARRYGKALKTLGYVHNDDWVNDCLPSKDMT